MIAFQRKTRFTGIPGGIVLVVALIAAGCQGKHSRVAVQNEEEPQTQLASVIRMNDPAASSQLVSGFYGLENNSWRWTAGKFSALFRTPPGAAQTGAAVNFNFTLPEVVIQQLGPIALSAAITGTALKTENYNKAGAYTFTADVPPNLLTSDSVKIDFALNKHLPPGVDKRELGVITTSVGLIAK